MLRYKGFARDPETMHNFLRLFKFAQFGLRLPDLALQCIKINDACPD